MKRVATSVRCVPRFGYEGTQVRTVDLDLCDSADEREILRALELWFIHRGIQNAIYDIEVDPNGFFAVINDEAYEEDWGTPVF